MIQPEARCEIEPVREGEKHTLRNGFGRVAVTWLCCSGGDLCSHAQLEAGSLRNGVGPTTVVSSFYLKLLALSVCIPDTSDHPRRSLGHWSVCWSWMWTCVVDSCDL